ASVFLDTAHAARHGQRPCRKFGPAGLLFRRWGLVAPFALLAAQHFGTRVLLLYGGWLRGGGGRRDLGAPVDAGLQGRLNVIPRLIRPPQWLIQQQWVKNGERMQRQ